jgi:hypothetical protein
MGISDATGVRPVAPGVEHAPAFVGVSPGCFAAVIWTGDFRKAQNQDSHVIHACRSGRRPLLLGSWVRGDARGPGFGVPAGGYQFY